MTMTLAKSSDATKAWHLVTHLQETFAAKLHEINQITTASAPAFHQQTWLRNQGLFGGGSRLTTDNSFFNRASINVSQVHYDTVPEKKLGSATALSTIIHPDNPRSPSIHMHISWTEYKDQKQGYWRLMADLNPAITNAGDTEAFDICLRQTTGQYYEHGCKQGEKYFHIPLLNRHRGVSHFYLEAHSSQDSEADSALAKNLGQQVIDTYIAILKSHSQDEAPSAEERQAQLWYHTLYFLQVLTLDRGTTTGLLVHNENDLGILASLPAHIDLEVLQNWADQVTGAPRDLIKALANCFETTSTRVAVSEAVKTRLAEAIRHHYRSHPQALEQQASGFVVPPTVANHLR